MFVFTRRRDEPFCLVAARASARAVQSQNQGRPEFEHYATVVPVRFRGRQVEACFLTRWDTQVRRVRAVHCGARPRGRPGAPRARRYPH
jgi:hypothetical protein